MLGRTMKIFFLLMATCLLLRRTRAEKPQNGCINFDFEHLKAYHAIFNAYDLDRNGLISRDELRVVMNHNSIVPVTWADVEEVLKGFYFPGNCYADFAGFLHLFVVEQHGAIHFDENHRAYVTYKQMMHIAKFLEGKKGTDKGANTFFQKCDTNRNGRMEIYEELLDCLTDKDNQYDTIGQILKAIRTKDMKPLLLLVKQLAKK